MMTHDEFTKVLEAEKMATLQKDLSRGVFDHLTKADFHEILEAFAADYQREGETEQQAYTNFIEETSVGKALFKAYKSAPSTSGHIEKSAYVAEIQRVADQHFPEITSPQQRFTRAIDTDKHGRPFDKVAHSLYQVAKSVPGTDVAPATPEAHVDLQKAVAEKAGSANARMLELARQRQKIFPTESAAQAFVHVWSDPGNGALKQEAFQENWSAQLNNVGDREYDRSHSLEGRASDYRNPHTPPGAPKPSSKSEIPKFRHSGAVVSVLYACVMSSGLRRRKLIVLRKRPAFGD